MFVKISYTVVRERKPQQDSVYVEFDHPDDADTWVEAFRKLDGDGEFSFDYQNNSPAHKQRYSSKSASHQAMYGTLYRILREAERAEAAR